MGDPTNPRSETMGVLLLMPLLFEPARELRFAKMLVCLLCITGMPSVGDWMNPELFKGSVLALSWRPL